MYRKAFEHARHLILDTDPDARDLVHRHASDRHPVESDPATAWLQLAAQQLEEGALAGAVRADQAAQLTLPQAEVHAVDRAHSAKALLQVAGFERSLRGSCRSGVSRREPCRVTLTTFHRR